MYSKIEKLKEIIKGYESVIVGYSGGIDSTLLCYYSNEILKENFLAVLTISETFTEEEYNEALLIAKKYNWPIKIIETKELENKNFTNNTQDKCKWCKEIKATELFKLAQKENYKEVLMGDNSDDLKDYRPGFKQSQIMGIKSPFIEANITKDEIRQISKELKLPNFDKPSTPCIASRIPYGIEITTKNLKQIEKAERFIKKLGYKVVRVRHEKNTAKI
ncbi:MAG: ATP-dependent sacrificial sulfur transferase LarE [Vampirovibrionia bacterium]